MKLNDNWVENFNKFKKKQKTIRTISNILSTIVVSVLVVSYFFMEYVTSPMPLPYFLVYMTTLLLGTYSSNLRLIRLRGEIYIDILEKNGELNVELIKERMPKKLLHFKRSDAIAHSTNKDLKVLRKYGVLDVSDEDLLPVQQ